MIYPAPTTKIDHDIARGTLERIVEPTPAKPGFVVLSFANTSYQMHLSPTAPIITPVGKRILGVIEAEARRVDVVDTGGKYVEPVFGHPRRVQGRVLERRAGGAPGGGGGVIVVDAGMPIHCRVTDQRQKAEQFAIGDLVSFDVRDGATFTPQA
jgi:hypothetical protein